MSSAARILIVEDNPLIALLMQVTVGNMGYRVLGPAMNLPDAMALVEGGGVDYALLDFDLGDGIDVTPVAEALVARDIGFAFTSGTSLRILRDVFVNAPVLPKPVREEDLEHVLPAKGRRNAAWLHRAKPDTASRAAS